MTAGYHAPLPPARTGVADYAAALLSALRNHGTVAPGTAQAEVELYHLGNNQLHRQIYEQALARPGVVVLHDAVLHHFFLGSLDRAAYMEEFVYNYGEWHRALAEELWDRRASSGFDQRYFEYPMLRRIAERSRAVIVHNPGAARMVRQHAANANVIEIPHLFAAPSWPAGYEVVRMREVLGVPPSSMVFAVFGFLRESKRLFTVLRAFAKLRRERPEVRLLIAGPFASSDLERAITPLLHTPGILRLPYLAEHDFWRAALAVDACINLRAPAAGETSGIAIRLMGAGKPVLVTEGLESSRFPEAACARIAQGMAEEDSVLHHMFLLTAMRECAREIGRQAAAHIAAHHQADRVAAQYWETLCACR